jgi:hypothetical protein
LSQPQAFLTHSARNLGKPEMPYCLWGNIVFSGRQSLKHTWKASMVVDVVPSAPVAYGCLDMSLQLQNPHPEQK